MIYRRLFPCWGFEIMLISCGFGWACPYKDWQSTSYTAFNFSEW